MKKEQEMNQEPGIAVARQQILNKNSSFVTKEAYKTLRTNIRFSVQREGCKRICITSAASGEGKSVTLLNLAISIAEAGQKVLLIDADMRRPTVARLLVETATPGLSNVLAGLITAEEVVRADVYPNLDIIFSGDIPPNPSELLSGDKMEQLIKRMSEKYDYILVDTPPVNVVTDASLVASLLDGVLLLVRQRLTRKDAVKRAVANLQLTDANILGFVFNGAEMHDVKRYVNYSYGKRGYGRGYRRGYGRGYGSGYSNSYGGLYEKKQ